MAAPGRHEQAKREGEREPVGREEICDRWLDKRPGGVLLVEAIDDDDENDCQQCEYILQ